MASCRPHCRTIVDMWCCPLRTGAGAGIPRHHAMELFQLWLSPPWKLLVGGAEARTARSGRDIGERCGKIPNRSEEG
jgi:hypothetical protein